MNLISSNDWQPEIRKLSASLMSHFLHAVIDRAVDFHFHRAGRDMEFLRDLGMGAKLQPGCDKHFSLAIRQLADDAHEFPDLVAIDHLLVRSRPFVAN